MAADPVKAWQMQIIQAILVAAIGIMVTVVMGLTWYQAKEANAIAAEAKIGNAVTTTEVDNLKCAVKDINTKLERLPERLRAEVIEVLKLSRQGNL